MADPITWGLINLVKKSVKGVQTTLDGVKNSVDTLPEDVQTKLDAFEVTIDELKKNVEDTLADVQETVEKSPAGNIAPTMKSISSASTEEGINVSFTANVIGQYGTDNLNTVITKGVMVRYSDTAFPKNRNDGNLGFIEEDIVNIGANGALTPKQKTGKIVGLTNGKTYYITAFPYTTYNAYNEGMGTTQCTKCQWTGTKGTLTVKVTQDLDFFDLGEVTVTLTPLSGDPLTQTISGIGMAVFSGLEAGAYTMSFSKQKYFTEPQSESVTVVAGQSKQLNKEYIYSAKLSDFTWEEIHQHASSGLSSKIFNLGDTSRELQMMTLETNNKTFVVEGEYIHTTCRLIGINENGWCAFLTNDVCVQPYLYYSSNNDKYLTECFNYVKTNYTKILPDISNYLAEGTFQHRTFSTYHDDSDFIYETEKIQFPTVTSLNEYKPSGIKKGFPYFTNKSSRSIGVYYKLMDTLYDNSESTNLPYIVYPDGTVNYYNGLQIDRYPKSGIPLIFIVK